MDAVEEDDILWERQRASGIPAVSRWAVWENLTTDANNNLEILKLQQWHPSQGSIWIEGPVGSGKTTLVSALANSFLRRPMTMTEVMLDDNNEVVATAADGSTFNPPMQRREKTDAGMLTLAVKLSERVTFRFVDEPEFYRDSRAFERHGRRLDLVDPVKSACNCSVLVIDDFGKICDGKRDVDIMRTMMRRRHSTGKPIVVTTNRRISDLDDDFGESLVSRLLEMCTLRLTLKGRDRRLA